MVTLLPCPFCKSKADSIATIGVITPTGEKGARAVIFCENLDCGCKIVKWASTPEQATEKALKVWNRGLLK